MSKRSQFDKILEKFEHVVREHAFLGAAHPDDRGIIEAEYQQQRNKIIAYHYHNVERSRGTKVKGR